VSLPVGDTRRHRGPHPEDAKLFADAWLPALRAAVAEMSWLLSRGYGEKATRKLVGDRHGLTYRQRLAIWRAACSDARRKWRGRHRRPLADLAGQTLLIDGYNVLTSAEAALAGGLLMRCRDRAVRDLASIHGSFRRVAETAPAADHLGRLLESAGAEKVHWLLDQPVSNSGRLRALLAERAQAAGWPWEVHLMPSPDAALKASDQLVATADSAVLDAGGLHLDLIGELCRQPDTSPWLIDLDASIASD